MCRVENVISLTELIIPFYTVIACLVPVGTDLITQQAAGHPLKLQFQARYLPSALSGLMTNILLPRQRRDRRT